MFSGKKNDKVQGKSLLQKNYISDFQTQVEDIPQTCSKDGSTVSQSHDAYSY
jgi:hypothetical protein